MRVSRPTISQDFRDVAGRIRRFNRGRNDLVRRKFARLTINPFLFLRGTCHLFYEDWPPESILNTAPATWISGDLHLENFGTFQTHDQQVYFGINDFDEALLAPFAVELARLVTSLFVWGQTASVATKHLKTVAQQFLTTYVRTVCHNKHNGTDSAYRGEIKRLIKKTTRRNDSDLIKLFTIKENGKRLLLVNPWHALPIDGRKRQVIEAAIERARDDLGFSQRFTVVDVARRVAGTGSLGVNRYLILVTDGADAFLLDAKHARPSAGLHYVRQSQPRWTNEAERVVSVQSWSRRSRQRFLLALRINKEDYVIREMWPLDNGLVVSDRLKEPKRLEQLLKSLAILIARGHLQCADIDGAASVDELAQFSVTKEWQVELIDFALQYSRTVYDDWVNYCERFDLGAMSGT